jgi:transposase-like protein
MKKTRDGKRRFSPEFKIAAVRRVNEGESPHAVARDLDVNAALLWKWRKQVTQEGERALKEIGRPKGSKVRAEATEGSYQRRIAELERLVGRQQMEIRFLDRALRQVEELRQEKNDDGAAASTKR